MNSSKSLTSKVFIQSKYESLYYKFYYENPGIDQEERKYTEEGIYRSYSGNE